MKGKTIYLIHQYYTSHFNTVLPYFPYISAYTFQLAHNAIHFGTMWGDYISFYSISIQANIS